LGLTRCAVHQLSRRADEIAPARRAATGFVDRFGLAVDRSAVSLAVSEAVTNALVHGRGFISLALFVDDDGGLSVAVSDEGTAPTSPTLTRREVGGWGLRMIDELTDRWGVERRADRLVVWMRFQPMPATRGP
jgi:serine/threonine-protein kinase RsbW